MIMPMRATRLETAGAGDLQKRLEEVRRRDHRRLGRELELFSFHQEAPASPFFHPRGAIVYNALIDLMRSDIRAERIAIITEVMDFTEKEASMF